MIITMRDLREIGYCAIGARRVAKNSGIDFKKFLREGITLEEIQEKCPKRFSEEITKAYGDRS